MRIVSLLPSATEIVFALGLGDDLVGVSHECDWPPEAMTRTVVTRNTVNRRRASSRRIHERVTAAVRAGHSLYELDEAALAELRPDLILTQELCEVCAVSYRRVNEAVRRLDGPVTVVSLEPTSIEGIFNTIQTVGAMTASEDAAVELLEELRERLRNIELRVEKRRDRGFRPPRVVALEWLDPPFAVGHWVPEQIQRAGGWDLLGRAGERAYRTNWRTIRDVAPEMILLMPCGFHLDDTLREWARTRRPAGWEEIPAVARSHVFALDGSSYFSRPGPRVIDGIELLAEIFDPEEFVETSPFNSWTPVVP